MLALEFLPGDLLDTLIVLWPNVTTVNTFNLVNIVGVKLTHPLVTKGIQRRCSYK